jgi:hypothetical protein
MVYMCNAAVECKHGIVTLGPVQDVERELSRKNRPEKVRVWADKEVSSDFQGRNEKQTAMMRGVQGGKDSMLLVRVDEK